MKKIRIQLVRNKAWIADQCDVADSFIHRLKGLIGRQSLGHGQGLLIRPCNDIHMWFMKIPIDAVFVQRQPGRPNYYRVSSFRENLRPWRILPVHDWSASDTLELPAGTVRRCEIQVGDELCISSE